jgi:hypothetical protein
MLCVPRLSEVHRGRPEHANCPESTGSTGEGSASERGSHPCQPSPGSGALPALRDGDDPQPAPDVEPSSPEQPRGSGPGLPHVDPRIPPVEPVEHDDPSVHRHLAGGGRPPLHRLPRHHEWLRRPGLPSALAHRLRPVDPPDRGQRRARTSTQPRPGRPRQHRRHRRLGGPRRMHDAHRCRPQADPATGTNLVDVVMDLQQWVPAP